MHKLTQSSFEELCEEFGIRNERADAFAGFIDDLDEEWSLLELASNRLGPERVKRLRQQVRYLEAITASIRESVIGPEAVDAFFRWRPAGLPLTDEGALNVYRLYWEQDFPESSSDRGDPEPSTDVGQAAAALIVEHALAIVHYVLARQLRYHDAVLDFSPDNEPRPRGRPKNGPRALIVRLLLERSATFLDCPPSYADGQPFVHFCERLLEEFGVEPGDTAQHIKRAMTRQKRRAAGSVRPPQDRTA